MEFKNLKLERRGRFLLLTLQRPEKLNALSLGLLSELKVCLNDIQRDPSGLRGLMVTGSGEKAFVAGADIREMSQMSATEGEAFGRLGQEVMSLFESLPIPVIACVQGFALGGGCELAMGCDFIYCTETAVFGQPEVSLGLIPGFGGCVRLIRFVGPGRARELIFSGRQVDATEALRIGLVNRVFSSRDEMMKAAEACLDEMALKSPQAIATCKRVMRQVYGLSVDEALEVEALGFRDAFVSFDSKIGVKAFVEKRKVEF